jgi:hypothetical protein
VNALPGDCPIPELPDQMPIQRRPATSPQCSHSHSSASKIVSLYDLLRIGGCSVSTGKESLIQGCGTALWLLRGLLRRDGIGLRPP